MILSFPILFIVVIAYNLAVFFANADLQSEIFSMTMVSGGYWAFTLSDLFISVSLLFLFIEILKATRTGAGSILDHLLSTLLFIVCLVEFLLVQQAATSTFFIIMLIGGQGLEALPLDERQQIIMVHSGLGTLVLLLMIVRLSWRLAHEPPGPTANMGALQIRLSKIVHWALYVLLLLQRTPITLIVVTVVTRSPVVPVAVWIHPIVIISQL